MSQKSVEELIAELSAAMLSSKAGIQSDMENHAAYIKGWLSKLKNDKTLILSGSQGAQKAVDRILGVTFEKKEESETTSEVVSENVEETAGCLV